jgi:hypothetical protein
MVGQFIRYAASSILLFCGGLLALVAISSWSKDPNFARQTIAISLLFLIPGVLILRSALKPPLTAEEIYAKNLARKARVESAQARAAAADVQMRQVLNAPTSMIPPTSSYQGRLWPYQQYSTPGQVLVSALFAIVFAIAFGIWVFHDSFTQDCTTTVSSGSGESTSRTSCK